MGEYVIAVEDHRLALGYENWRGPTWMYGYLWNMTPDGENLYDIAADELWRANYRRNINSSLVMRWSPSLQ
jgi:hypothetical protein